MEKILIPTPPHYSPIIRYSFYSFWRCPFLHENLFSSSGCVSESFDYAIVSDVLSSVSSMLSHTQLYLTEIDLVLCLLTLPV